MDWPSGAQCGLLAPVSKRVSGRLPPFLASSSHSRDWPRLSSSAVSRTEYTAQRPSGDSCGPLTRSMLTRSVAVKGWAFCACAQQARVVRAAARQVLSMMVSRKFGFNPDNR